MPQNRLFRFCALLFRRFLRHDVGIQAAALAFYLLFMIFPFMIFISTLLGQLQLDISGILLELGEFLPRELIDFLKLYLTYVSAHPSTRLMTFGLIFSIYFPMRAANSLMRCVRRAYHLGPPKAPVIHWLKALLFTVLLLADIVLTFTLMTVGERLLLYAVANFRLPVFAADLWAELRFPAAGVMTALVLFALYAFSQDQRRPIRDILPGVLASLSAWMLLSWLYSRYAENLADYSALYGSIGTVIVVLIWLNLSALTLIMGAEFNGTCISMRRDRAAQEITD